MKQRFAKVIDGIKLVGRVVNAIFDIFIWPGMLLCGLLFWVRDINDKLNGN